MSCFVGLQQKRLKKKSFRSRFAFEIVSGDVKWARHLAGNSCEKAPDLWESLNSTSVSCWLSTGGVIPQQREIGYIRARH